MFKPRSVHIVDPGLIEAGGHYYTQDFSIAKECQKRGIPVTICCRHGASFDAEGINLLKIFRFDVFVEQPVARNPNFAVFENYFLVNRAFMQDLLSIPSLDFSPDDLVYFPTLTQNQIEAVTDWVISLPAAKRPRIAITLRLLNSQMHYNLNRGYAPAIEFLYQQALWKLAERHPHTYLFADTEVLCINYQNISGIPITLAPIPQLPFHVDAERKRASDDGTLSILYLGNVSPYRGNNFIAGIIDSVLDEFPNVRFTIQVKTDPDSDAARAMTAISEAHSSHVQFLFGTLTSDEYVSTMQSADIVFMPYMPSYYSFGSSGVFTEAAAMGKVLVTTAGTSMETSINRSGLGAAIAPEYTPESLATALKNAIVNFAELDQKSGANYARFAHENSPEGFLDHMFAKIG